MPELPEVETVRRGLKNTIVGKTIGSLEILREKQLSNCTPAVYEDFCRHETFADIQRRGKYLIVVFESGKKIVVHLRMTGKFIFKDNTDPVDPAHIRQVYTMTDGTILLYQDLRVFGTFKTYYPGDTITEFTGIGPEPFDERITAEWLQQKAAHRKAGIKVILLDQRVIAGLGNIYVCEALFRTGINPELPVSALSRAVLDDLIRAIRDIISLAIEKNGTSVSDYKTVDNKSGEFQNMLQVYGKEGEVCPACKKTTIKRIKQAQRSTFFCPVCQK